MLPSSNKGGYAEAALAPAESAPACTRGLLVASCEQRVMKHAFYFLYCSSLRAYALTVLNLRSKMLVQRRFHYVRTVQAARSGHLD